MNKLTPLSTGLAFTKTARVLVIATILSTLIVSSLQAQQNPVSQRSLDPEERTNVNVFKQASPSVVNICTKQALTARSGDVVLDLGRIPKGSGSGFIWDASGHVVTNYHVIQGADAVQVTLADGTEWNASIVSSAPEFDVAVLRVDAPPKKLQPLAIGRSDDLEVGQKVFAIGNPFGLDQTLTAGIISGLGRQIDSKSGRPIRGVVQTDAAINPGNSGGPLLDNEGRLIGINTAILTRSGGSSGVGFAVPVNTIRTAVPQLIAGLNRDRGFLGIALAPEQISKRASENGIAILQVVDNSPAKDSGLRAAQVTEDGVAWGDILMSIDGQQVTNSDAALETLQSRKSGDEVMLGIKRGEEFIRINVRLTNRPKTIR
ncbi:trypsin-like peptidase domain-containing protein [Mariniblastus sp.]|nr:trypsin-like peptidase domain-containing protein [Mariniblastus sp.]